MDQARRWRVDLTRRLSKASACVTKEGKSHEAATQSNAIKMTKPLATRALLYLGTEDEYIRKLVTSLVGKRDERMNACGAST